MRRIVLLIFPVIIAATVWILAADESDPPEVAALAQEIAEESDDLIKTPASNSDSLLVATPRPPRKTRVAELRESPEEHEPVESTRTEEPEIDLEIDSIEEKPAEPMAKAVYTPRPPRKDTPTASNIADEPSNTPPFPTDPDSSYEDVTAKPTPAGGLFNNKYIRQGLSGSNMVALTFDDGPNAEYTPQFLAYLRENNIPATFFLLGESIEKNPAVLIEMAEYGFELGNHSFSHPSFAKASEQTIRLQLKNTSDLIEQHTGIRPVLMRPPFGATNEAMKAICDEMGLDVVLWSVDTNDWKANRTVEGILETVEKELKGGAIILMHDRLECTLEALPLIVNMVKEKGYKLVTVSELIREARSAGQQPAPSEVTSTP